MAELLVHGKPAEVNASALDALFGVELESVMVEECPRRKTDVGSDARRADGKQRRLDVLVEHAGNTTPGKRWMGEKKVKVAVVRVRSKARENAIRLGHDGMKRCKTRLPACSIVRRWGPCSNLVCRVIGCCQRANRSRIDLGKGLQVGGLIWPYVHRKRVESLDTMPV